jgi:hypothetical protein
METAIRHWFWPGRAAGADSLRYPAHQKRHRRATRFSALALTLTLALSIVAIPPGPALAGGQVLELPQAAAPSSPPAPTYETPPPSAPAPEPSEVADAAPPPGVGGIDDYMHQDGQPPSTSQAGNAQSYSSQQPDPRANRSSATTDAIVAAVALGMIALDIYAAHHHR